MEFGTIRFLLYVILYSIIVFITRYIFTTKTCHFFQDRCGVVSANGGSALENMRGLEHYLNDIMRPQQDSTDIKGNFCKSNQLYRILLVKSMKIIPS